MLGASFYIRNIKYYIICNSTTKHVMVPLAVKLNAP